MTSQPIPSEALAVLTAQGIRLPQTEKPRAPSQTQQSLEKWLKAELSVFGFIVSGSLSIITEKKSTKPLVHSSLACSILSTVLAVLGVALLSYTLAALDSAFQECELSRMSRPTTQSYFYFHRESYSTDCFVAKASVMGVLSVMLLCSVLELGLAVLTVVLWWKQARAHFPGIVLFQSYSHKNNPSIFSKTHGDSGYEELVTS
ncbi:membrane-spanning 4-domains subfamily A member 6D isoform X3 [Heterocephalus glaber]|uniref:Membrane-spanning 4-domains subfamily A member 6D isoform X3 n=1 Tax=Heterocephalus glaber TaxID=10181 RepID=A0AAX6QBW4_HETGA|nr:membrane-spanning 4-domains subfamily A member 6D isoform X3 [Heterocephalus glaber]